MLKTKTQKARNASDLELDFAKVKKAHFILRAVNHKVRQRMLNLIHRNKEMTVSEIYGKLRLEQSQTSAYLAILRRAGIVNARRDGQSVYYSINYKSVSFVEEGAKIISYG